MPFPSLTIPYSLELTGWWLPVLGLVLTGLGAGLVTVAVGDLVAPIRPARSTAGSTVAVEPIAGRAVFTAPVGSGAWTGAGVATHVAPGRRDRPANCPGVDLATGRRPESAHLATVTLLRPAECGDLRDVIKAMAALPHTGQHTDQNLEPTAADPHRAEGIDLFAAALYGPPDRLPQAMLEAKTRDRGRGWLRGYLERATASRLLAPG